MSRIWKKLILLTLMAFCGCVNKEGPQVLPSPPDNKKAIVSFTMVTDTYIEADTKSSFTWDDKEINDIEILVFDEEAGIYDIIYSKTWPVNLSFIAEVGSTYSFYAIANLGEKISVQTLDELMAIKRSISFSEINKCGIPMAAVEGVSCTIKESDNEVVIPLTRLLARIDFSIDKSALTHADEEGFRVNSVSLYNAINTFSPFSKEQRQERKGQIDYNFDKCSPEDIAVLNSGGGISLYAFENLQGTLLPFNSDPWLKVPEMVEASDYCTYLEVKASYSAGGLSYGELTYRMYLGSDNIGNFDLHRNRIYKLKLIPSEEEMDGNRGSWKISSKDWNDSRSLSFVPKEVRIPPLGSAEVKIETEPGKFDITLSGYEWLADAGCSLNFDKEASAITISNTLGQEEEAEGTIIAESWDRAIFDICNVTVESYIRPKSIRFKEKEVELYVNGPNAGDKGSWHPVLIVSYSDGSEREVYATLSSSDSSIAIAEGSSILGAGIGTAEISASYTEKGIRIESQEPATVRVSDPLLGIDAEPEQLRIDIYAEKRYNVKKNMNNGNIRIVAHRPSGDTLLSWSDITWSFGGKLPHGFKMGSYLSDGELLVYQAYNGSSTDMIASYTLDGITKSDSIELLAYTGDLVQFYILPQEKTIEIGETIQLTGRAVYSTGSKINVYSLYCKTDSDCVTLDNSYYSCDVTGIRKGTAIIRVSYKGVEAQSIITVTADDVISYELILSDESLNLEAGYGKQVTAIWKTFRNSVLEESKDVSSSASWTVKDNTIASASLGYIKGISAGSTTVNVQYGEKSETIYVSVWEPEPEPEPDPEPEPEPEIVSISVQPDPLNLELNGQQTMQLTARWSDGSVSVIENELCDWSITSGQNSFSISSDGTVKCIAAGENGTGKASLKGNASISDSFAINCSTVLKLTASVSRLDTWGGNSYSLSFRYGGTSVSPKLKSLSISGNAPDDLLSYKDCVLTAADWWGRSGSWMTAKPEYRAVFEYEGSELTISGEMHGTSGFKDVVISDSYFREILTTPSVSKAMLTGSEDLDCKEKLILNAVYSDADLSKGHLKVGQYEVEYSLVDPTNGISRSGKGSFSVITNVINICGEVTVYDCVYAPDANKTYEVKSEINGGTAVSIGIPTNGHDYTPFKVVYDILYTDIHGNVHLAHKVLEEPDYGEVPPLDSDGGVEPQEQTPDDYVVNGFKFIIHWYGM